MRIIYGDSPISLGDSLWITIISMLIVFFVLILISFILSFLKYIPSEKKEIKTVKSSTESNTVVSLSECRKLQPEVIKDDKMLAAVSVAVMEAAGETENSYIRVKSIREIR